MKQQWKQLQMPVCQTGAILDNNIFKFYILGMDKLN